MLRLLWATGFLFIATLWLVVMTILWTGDSANQLSEQRERHLMTDAITELNDIPAALLSAIAGRDAGEDLPATSALPTPLAALPPPPQKLCMGVAAGDSVAPAYAVSIAVHGGQIRERIDPSCEDVVRNSAASGASEALHGEASSRLITRGSSLLVETVATLPARFEGGRLSSARILVAQRPVSEEALLETLRRRGIRDARLADRPSASGVLVVPDLPDAGNGRVLLWTSERPGDLMRERLLPIAVVSFAVAAILFAAVALYLWRTSADLLRSQDQSRELLGRDPLSGLANRLLFNHQLDARLGAIRNTDCKIAVLFIDLDRFKDVNDTYGHQAGDQLIQLVAQRLLNLLRGIDTLARFGGDEFAIIQADIAGAAEAETLARRILDALAEPFSLADSSITIGASIGFAVAPDHSNDREGLMRLADTALYQAKTEGRNRFSMFQRRMDETLRMRKTVADDLRRAIETDELVLHYQPQFAADGTTLVGVEALVRWPHPTRGLISPAEFIWIAEEQGLIIPLGEWVLRRACLDGRRWPGLRIAVNVSPIQFRHRAFVDGILRVIRETGFDPGRLELELTEGVVVADAEAAEAAMIELRASGIHLALDDFGTGYSSLIYLRRFAFDTIKIDRSFLESMEATGESAILVHSIVHLGRALGLTVTAEGVETREQHRFLQALGCHQVQGYLFSRPVPARQIDELVARADLASAAA